MINIELDIHAAAAVRQILFESQLGYTSVVWDARKLLGKGEINYDQFMEMVASSAPSIGHCNNSMVSESRGMVSSIAIGAGS